MVICVPVVSRGARARAGTGVKTVVTRAACRVAGHAFVGIPAVAGRTGADSVADVATVRAASTTGIARQASAARGVPVVFCSARGWARARARRVRTEGTSGVTH